MKPTAAIDLTLLLNRLTLGALFVFAGVRKLLPDEGQTVWGAWAGFASYVADSAPLPHALGLGYGYALPVVEVVAGLLLVLGLYTRAAAVVIGLMLISFMIEFGVAWWPPDGPAFDKNVILLTLALLLAAAGAGNYALAPVLSRRKKGS